MKEIKLAVILAAGMGTRLRGVTGNLIPKGFLEVNKKSLVERSIEKLRSVGIEKIIIVTGNLNEFYDSLAKENDDIFTYKNEEFATTGSMYSLAVLKGKINEDFLLLESDIIYEREALVEAIKYKEEDCVMLSGATNSGDEFYVETKNGNMVRASKDKNELDSIYGEWVGISKISVTTFNSMVEFCEKSDMRQYHYEYAILATAKLKKIGYKKVENLVWAEIDDASHLERVNSLIIPKLIEKGEE